MKKVGEPVTPWAHNIHRIVVYNRTDCCGERLNGFQVFGTNRALPGPQALAHRTFWSSYNTAPDVMEIGVHGSPARYVYVMLSGTSILSLAEVEVYGTPR